MVNKKEPSVDDLPGVGAATAEKLHLGGFDNLMSIAVATPGELVDASGVTETAARKMIQAARSSMDMGFHSGEDLLAKRGRVVKIKTGSQNFDDMLEGGFETGAISECFGQYASSKTQIAHVLCVSCQAQDEDAVAVFIDTENTFRPERIIQIAKAWGLDPEKTLKNLYL